LLYILLGEDEYSRHQALEGIKASIGDASAIAANTTLFTGSQLALGELRNACETVPFLAEQRLIIVEGLLGRFEPGDRSKQRKKSEPRKGYGEIAACLRQLPDFSTVVLTDGKIGNRNPLFKELSPVAKVSNFPLLRGKELQSWISRRVAAGRGTISSRAVDLLARFVGGNLWIMVNEIDKLLLFTAGRSIEEADVVTMVSYVQEANVFKLVDAIIESRATAAGQWLQQLLQQGAAPAYLLVMLARQVRLMVMVKELQKKRRPRIEIQRALGVTHDAIYQRLLEQAARYSLVRLKEVYHHLLEADLAIKTGRYDSELALTIMVAELCPGAGVPAGA